MIRQLVPSLVLLLAPGLTGVVLAEEAGDEAPPPVVIIEDDPEAEAVAEDVAPPTPSRRAVATRATDRPPPARWSGTAELGYGYDSNVLRRSDDSVDASAESSTALTLGLRMNCRLIEETDTKLRLSGDYRRNDYGQVDAADLDQLGLRLTGQRIDHTDDGGLIVGGSGDLRHYRLDGDAAAMLYQVGAHRIGTGQERVHIAQSELRWIDYDERDDKDGLGLFVAYRLWLLTVPGTTHSRIEIAGRSGYQGADDSDLAYWMFTPSAVWRHRFGSGAPLDTVTVETGLRWEYRHYGSGDDEHQLAIDASARIPLHHGFEAGLDIGTDLRRADASERDYDRWNFAVHVLYNF